MTQVTTPGSKNQSDDSQLATAHCIWGPPSDQTDGGDHVDELQSYFAYYELQIKQSSLVSETVRQDHEQIHFFVQKLKENAQLSREQLRHSCEDAIKNKEALPQVRVQDVEHWLALAARILLCINCRLDRGAVVFAQSGVQVWEEEQSLVDLIQSVFPEHKTRSEDATSIIKPNKLRARYLENHADVKIVWTSNLADHLWLDIRDSGKELHIFELVCYLEASDTACKDAELAKGFILGSYNPKFLAELLKTYQLLFPVQDEPYLEKKVRKGRKDKRLCKGFASHHKAVVDTWPLTNRQELFERFPYWAVRLLHLYEEADDPTPISWIERFAERRKAARHTYLLTYLALILALLLGIVTVSLGVVQVWISYCAWQGDIGGICRSSAAADVLTAPSSLEASSTADRRPFHFRS